MRRIHVLYPDVLPMIESHPKLGTLMAYASCSALLGVSGYGFSVWIGLMQKVPVNEPGEIMYLAGFAIIPLLLFLLIALLLSQFLAQRRLAISYAASYQLRIDQLQKR